MKNTLLTFTGFHDPFTKGLVGQEEQPGPILSLVSARAFDLVVLFSTPSTEQVTVDTRDHLQRMDTCGGVEIRDVPLEDPTDYSSILRHLRRHIAELVEQHPDAAFSIAVASGTPQMHASWVLLAAGGEIPAKILHVRPSRFVTKDRPLVSEVDLSAREFPSVRARVAEVQVGPDVTPDLDVAIRQLGIIGDHPASRVMACVQCRLSSSAVESSIAAFATAGSVAAGPCSISPDTKKRGAGAVSIPVARGKRRRGLEFGFKNCLADAEHCVFGRRIISVDDKLKADTTVTVMNGGIPEPRLIGYARVSTDDQDLSLQIDALTKQGIPTTAIFMDKVSGAKTERPGLTKCLAALQSGDILVVWRLDRLGRSMRHLITLVEDLRRQGVGFRSLNEGAIDTTCASGELIFNIFSALAQFERRLIQERTKAGLAAARARGRNGGRPKVAAEEPKVVLAKKLHADKSVEIDDICKTLRISRSTFYRYVRL